ncbi:hypothetical protein F9C07_1259 [Aspergillus flavus]|uniref:Uncharacterized protein n=1 Tax=Aspergillus flavus (strain ATCC 200026 / FGSC A1120 / IAM 13836 / NRRL 3357 / JCM 12722 / SRRC 167) TaxID=332952 RepID=A0A7U2MQW0_ASPFN|nr:hypothetical protein F9C07_1259 [Aspergillus flavus]
MNQLRGGWSMIEAGLNLKQGGFSKYPYLSYKTIYRFRTPRSRSSSISRNVNDHFRQQNSADTVRLF